MVSIKVDGETKGIDWIIGSNGPGWDVGTKLSWDTLAQHNKARAGRAYRYYLPNSQGIRGVHGAEMPLMFGTYADNLGVLTKRPDSPNSRGLVDGSDPAVALISKRMIKSWANFCHTGDPSFKDEALGEGQRQR